MSQKSFHHPFREPTIAVTLRLSADLARWLDTQAQTRRVSRTKVVHDLLLAQQAMHEQLANSVIVGPAGTEPTGKQVLHVLLSHLKEEIAQSVDAQAREVQLLRQQLSIAQAMIDRAYYGFLLHTEPVPPEQRPQRTSDAQRRYERWVEEVHQRSQRGQRHGTAHAATAAGSAHSGHAVAGM